VDVLDVQNNGLVYGYYQLPVPEFIFPEDLVPGNLPPAYNFQDLPFLVSGNRRLGHSLDLSLTAN